jgi:peptide-methionine (R)-S-oxide reductase
VFQTVHEGFTRRRLLWLTPLALGGVVAIASRKSESQADAGDVTIVQFDDAGQNLGPARVKRVVRSDAEWRGMLTAEQFYVTRKQNTDTPFTGTYYQLHEAGLFRCVCCATALFSSETKYDSGTGWPSFWAPLAEENVYTRRDVRLLMERNEVLCRRCDAHLGHVFNDGPPPTGLRYCLNESSLRFVRRVQS